MMNCKPKTAQILRKRICLKCLPHEKFWQYTEVKMQCLTLLLLKKCASVQLFETQNTHTQRLVNFNRKRSEMYLTEFSQAVVQKLVCDIWGEKEVK